MHFDTHLVHTVQLAKIMRVHVWMDRIVGLHVAVVESAVVVIRMIMTVTISIITAIVDPVKRSDDPAPSPPPRGRGRRGRG